MLACLPTLTKLQTKTTTSVPSWLSPYIRDLCYLCYISPWTSSIRCYKKEGIRSLSNPQPLLFFDLFRIPMKRTINENARMLVRPKKKKKKKSAISCFGHPCLRRVEPWLNEGVERSSAMRLPGGYWLKTKEKCDINFACNAANLRPVSSPGHKKSQPLQIYYLTMQHENFVHSSVSSFS